MRHALRVLALVTLTAAAVARPAEALEFPGPAPGQAAARRDGNCLVLENNVISATWNVGPAGLQLTEVVDRMSDGTVRAGLGRTLVATVGDDGSVQVAALLPAGKATLKRVEPVADSVRRAGRSAGWKASVPLVSADGRLHAEWHATLRDGSNYVRQGLTVRAGAEDVLFKELQLLVLAAGDPSVCGEVDGSPVVADTLFFACEHPMADNRVEKVRDDIRGFDRPAGDGRLETALVVCAAPCFGPLRRGESWTRTAVIGVVPRGQLRRGYLYYLERERARPYGLFLHYNSWWDIAWGDRMMNEKQCLDVIEIFGRELVEKRGVRMDSFVFDDGWDDAETLWGFHDGFPEGFAPLQSAAAKYDSHVGTWLSPWGGYGRRKAQRLEYGRREGFETNARGFSLAGEKYYARFRDICAEMIAAYGVNYFKFDGIGQGGGLRGVGPEFAPDVEGLLRLTGELRRLRPDVYLSITTGTWPSPYWLWYGDSVWRNGHDWGSHGAGSVRQQWITYRDMITYRMIVRRAPLYPINSLMTVAVCYGQLGTATKMSDDVDDLVDEIRMAFGCGTQLLELYVTPQMMKPKAWDVLAEAATWSRRNADVLVDVHWIGGDPGEGQPYGYASWSPRKGILVLRNPSGKAAEMTVDLAGAFELPREAPRTYRLATRWPTAERVPELTLTADEPHVFELAPFEVLMLEAMPAE